MEATGLTGEHPVSADHYGGASEEPGPTNNMALVAILVVIPIVEKGHPGQTVS